MESKNTVIGVSIALLMIIFLFFACSDGSPKKKRQENFRQVKKEATSPNNLTIKKPKQVRKAKVAPASKYRLSDTRLLNIEKFREKAKANQKKTIEEESQRLLNDMSLPPATRARYQVRANKYYIKGAIAEKNKEYKVALKEYNDLLKQKDATPIMKYCALDGMQRIFREMRDLDGYILASKEIGKLISKEDLSLIDIEKSDDFLNWVIKFSKHMKARKDQRIMTNLIENIVGKNPTRKNADKGRVFVMKSIENYERLFKEFVK